MHVDMYLCAHMYACMYNMLSSFSFPHICMHAFRADRLEVNILFGACPQRKLILPLSLAFETSCSFSSRDGSKWSFLSALAFSLVVSFCWSFHVTHIAVSS